MKRLSFGLLLIPYVAIGQVSVATSFSDNMGFAKEMSDCHLEKTIPGKEVTAQFAGELRYGFSCCVYFKTIRQI